ncbi:MAG TPA: bacterial transcriptional activator domain-containing protein [Candidatus Elarobacter sp.]|nr:bacterial transcriptional activator domain-containing protein [Candidatus Elarobacter sp.]
MDNPIDQARHPSEIFVEAARGIVRRDGTQLLLSPREREVSVALAVGGRPLSAREIGAMLSPDTDRDDGVNLAKVYVHRLRRRVTPGFVVCCQGGYALSPEVGIDAVEARRAITRLASSRAPIDCADRVRLLGLAASLRAETFPALADREWFRPVGPSLHRLGHDLAMLVGRNALAHGLDADALHIGRELSYEDPCDEEAWELMITGHMRAGQEAAAVQGYRSYERLLAAELQTAPSAYLRSIVADCLVYDRATTAPRPSQNGRSLQRATLP